MPNSTLNVADIPANGLREWLEAAGFDEPDLTEVLGKFVENAISLDMMPLLSDDDIKELLPKVGWRMKVREITCRGEPVQLPPTPCGTPQETVDDDEDRDLNATGYGSDGRTSCDYGCQCSNCSAPEQDQLPQHTMAPRPTATHDTTEPYEKKETLTALKFSNDENPLLWDERESSPTCRIGWCSKKNYRKRENKRQRGRAADAADEEFDSTTTTANKQSNTTTDNGGASDNAHGTNGASDHEAGGGVTVVGRRSEKNAAAAFLILAEKARDAIGMSKWNPGQKEAVVAVLSGRDVLAWLRTGGGKSLIFMAIAQVYELQQRFRKMVVVISPLISLMQDQTKKINAGTARHGLKAVFLGGGSRTVDAELEAVQLGAGECNILFMSPEKSEWLSSNTVANRVGLLVVDEAHKLLEDGMFRPAWIKQVPNIRGKLPHKVPVVAMSATMPPSQEGVFKSRMGVVDAVTIRGKVDRPDIFLDAQHKGGPKKDIPRIHRAIVDARACGGSEAGTIVYCPARAEVKKVAKSLEDLGLKVGVIHGHGGEGSADDHYAKNAEVLRAWLGGELDTVVANSAFGLGIDHPRVVLVVLYGMPQSIEAYWQYAGRLARSPGVIGHCILYHQYSDRRIIESWADDCSEEKWLKDIR